MSIKSFWGILFTPLSVVKDTRLSWTSDWKEIVAIEISEIFLLGAIFQVLQIEIDTTRNFMPRLIVMMPFHVKMSLLFWYIIKTLLVTYLRVSFYMHASLPSFSSSSHTRVPFHFSTIRLRGCDTYEWILMHERIL